MRSARTYIGICCAGFMLLAGCAGPKSSTTTVTHAEDKAATDNKVADEGKLKKVVIKPVNSTGVAEDDASGIASKFCIEVSKSKKIELVCADDMKTLLKLKEDLIFFGECNEEDCLAKLGQRLNAEYIIQCSIKKVGETLLMNVNLVEGNSGKVKVRLSKEAPSGKVEDLLEVADELAAKLITEF
jgi:TolB-like protein